MPEVELQEGRPQVLTFNRPAKFRIELAGGSYIEGVIPANADFTLCSKNGDFAKVNIAIDDDSFHPLALM